MCWLRPQCILGDLQYLWSVSVRYGQGQPHTLSEIRERVCTDAIMYGYIGTWVVWCMVYVWCMYEQQHRANECIRMAHRNSGNIWRNIMYKSSLSEENRLRKRLFLYTYTYIIATYNALQHYIHNTLYNTRECGYHRLLLSLRHKLQAMNKQEIAE